MKAAPVLVGLVALCAAGAAPRPITAQDWLAAIPPLPSTSADAYAQWTDTSSSLKPGPGFQQVSDGIAASIQTLARPVAAAEPPGGAISRHDQELARQIVPLPAGADPQQAILQARSARVALEQKWRGELNALEQQRLLERTAMPACHNESGTPSQLAIRDVERTYMSRRIAIAARYLPQFEPVLRQLLAAVSPQISHGDQVMAAWKQLRSGSLRAQLAPVAQSAETAALQDVTLVLGAVQEISKLAARPVADLKALERVYAQAKGC
ncbi:MAG TPA: hypothetical protein VLX90_16785 [Steroidobacteraceae bacterium]|nr:hypothetical protein [Steroidobacteraceae bacterium]